MLDSPRGYRGSRTSIFFVGLSFAETLLVRRVASECKWGSLPAGCGERDLAMNVSQHSETSKPEERRAIPFGARREGPRLGEGNSMRSTYKSGMRPRLQRLSMIDANGLGPGWKIKGGGIYSWSFASDDAAHFSYLRVSKALVALTFQWKESMDTRIEMSDGSLVRQVDFRLIDMCCPAPQISVFLFNCECDH
jgi:hypothetical protein